MIGKEGIPRQVGGEGKGVALEERERAEEEEEEGGGG